MKHLTTKMQMWYPPFNFAQKALLSEFIEDTEKERDLLKVQKEQLELEEEKRAALEEAPHTREFVQKY